MPALLSRLQAEFAESGLAIVGVSVTFVGLALLGLAATVLGMVAACRSRPAPGAP